jgi:hypothetical protein
MSQVYGGQVRDAVGCNSPGSTADFSGLAGELTLRSLGLDLARLSAGSVYFSREFGQHG